MHMKLFILAVALVGTQGLAIDKYVDESCLDRCINHEVKGTVFCADPNSCGSFYECSEDVIAWLKCPANNLWDTKSQTCNDQLKVDCGSRPSSTTTAAPQPTTPEPTVPPTEQNWCRSLKHPDGVKFACTKDCTSYWQCTSAVAHLKHCDVVDGEQQVFNPVINQCDFAYNYPCDSQA